MGKLGGFLEYERVEPGYRPRDERVADYQPVEKRLDADQTNRQAARCMNCGIPFCLGSGCPLGNVIPEFNDAVYRKDWRLALDILLSTSNFPEFTARICPAPCETACVLEFSDEAPVAIRQIEMEVIEKGFELGYMAPHPPQRRSGRRIAIVGAGPAGMACANTLNRHGHSVVVYDQWPKPGGILRYGIPDFKLEKSVVDRRIRLMEAEGVDFECSVTVGRDVSYRYLETRFDAVVLTGGAQKPRDLPVPGRELDGIHFAMDFLTRQNRKNDGEVLAAEDDIVATGKNVLVIGGGDTGSDCIGTSMRQGARSVTQVEIMPKPPERRAPNTPWPLWPLKLRTSSSHKEGGDRIWSASATAFEGDDAGAVARALCIEMDADFSSGRPRFEPKPGTEFALDCELVLLAMGFTGPAANPMIDELGLGRDPRGNIAVDETHMTTRPSIFAAGDMARGQSLVVRAMADGRDCAHHIHAYLQSQS